MGGEAKPVRTKGIGNEVKEGSGLLASMRKDLCHSKGMKKGGEREKKRLLAYEHVSHPSNSSIQQQQAPK